MVCLAHNEPLGLVALEAMSCGIPVIGVNEGGYKETIIDGHSGYLINRNPNELFIKMKKMLENVSTYNIMAHNARKKIEVNWTWERSTQKIENEFIKLVGKRHNKKVSAF